MEVLTCWRLSTRWTAVVLSNYHRLPVWIWHLYWLNLDFVKCINLYLGLAVLAISVLGGSCWLSCCVCALCHGLTVTAESLTPRQGPPQFTLSPPLLLLPLSKRTHVLYCIWLKWTYFWIRDLCVLYILMNDLRTRESWLLVPFLDLAESLSHLDLLGRVGDPEIYIAHIVLNWWLRTLNHTTILAVLEGAA